MNTNTPHLSAADADLIYGMLTQRLYLRSDDPDRDTVVSARDSVYPFTTAYAEAQEAKDHLRSLGIVFENGCGYFVEDETETPELDKVTAEIAAAQLAASPVEVPSTSLTEDQVDALTEKVYGVERNEPCANGHFDCATVEGGTCAGEELSRLIAEAEAKHPTVSVLFDMESDPPVPLGTFDGYDHEGLFARYIGSGGGIRFAPADCVRLVEVTL